MFHSFGCQVSASPAVLFFSLLQRFRRAHLLTKHCHTRSAALQIPIAVSPQVSPTHQACPCLVHDVRGGFAAIRRGSAPSPPRPRLERHARGVPRPQPLQLPPGSRTSWAAPSPPPLCGTARCPLLAHGPGGTARTAAPRGILPCGLPLARRAARCMVPRLTPSGARLRVHPSVTCGFRRRRLRSTQPALSCRQRRTSRMPCGGISVLATGIRQRLLPV